jgi:hypothetical protein
MDRKERFLVSCTLAIIVTIVGCSWWIHKSIETNADWVLRDLEQLRR